MASGFIFRDSNNVVYDFSDVFIRKTYFIDGVLFHTGSNSGTAAGDGTVSNHSVPTISGASTSWKQIAAGGKFCAATKYNNTLWTWGLKTNGRLGNNTSFGQQSTPVQVGGLSDWKTLTCGYASVLAIKTDGTLWGWGSNGMGVLGDGTTVDKSSPVQIGTLNDWKQVALLTSHTLAIKTDGTLWAWGYNGFGVLGNEISAGVVTSSPIQIGALTDWKQVSCGDQFSAAIKTDGTLWTWGRNHLGQLGDGTIVNKSSPTQIGTLTDWNQLSTGYEHSMVIKTDGTLWAWGGNGTIGVLGAGFIGTICSSPIQVGALTDWKTITCGRVCTHAIKTDGMLWAWGDNTQGQLGNGQTFSSSSSPIQIGTATNWKQIAGGYQHTMMIRYSDI